MTTDSKHGADKVARVAGIWRPIEMSDGDILKLFQSGKQSEKNYRQFDGEWYVLDESTEGLQSVKEHSEHIAHYQSLLKSVGEENVKLHLDLAKCQAERDDLLTALKEIEWSNNDQWRTDRAKQAIAAISGEKNDK